MAQLVSASTVQAVIQGGYPQVMTIVQEFDLPVVVSSDFKLVFYGQYTETELNRQRGEMVGVPVQYVTNQLSYTIQVSPFARGRLGVLKQIGQITDLYGKPVDLLIGRDFDLYNTNLRAFFGDAILEQSWPGNESWPASIACPTNEPKPVRLKIGPWTNNMGIPDGMWNGGNFFYWVNYTFKPDSTAEGIPFVWEPPFYYAYSGFGFPLDGTISPWLPPWPGDPPSDSIHYNVCSSGPDSQGVYDTCGWIGDFPRWRGRVQCWCFGSDAFAESVVPWQFPATASPFGDLTPYSVFGFPPDAQEQFFKQATFSFVNL